jgi:CDGSH-type Zn-finger protein
MTQRDPGVTITPYPDGPLIVRGPAQLIDENGEPIERSRRTVALCRCGVSAIKPWCDGTHKLSGFRTAPPGDAPVAPSEAR